MLESLFNKVADLTPILRNICQRLLLHYTHTNHCYLSVLIYIQHLLTQLLLLLKQSSGGVLKKKGILRNFAKCTGKHLCQSLFFNKVVGCRPASLLKKTLAQVFSSEFWEISKNTFCFRTPLMVASDCC